ncbi:Serine--tRNA ligase [Methyloligella halotolerans]|uniref:Serine--tRNA ligase n=1 Tax=Methyloligella halotolerans TaxID=1177755 RepID=A0A1E2S337_9HYPH|nr:serine--tRNA ligase [Methyloligella halotolerans]ODA68745.1 Serine--tRNA ligase [Methyloligella halotolerans]
MLDIKWIRDNQDAFVEGLTNRGFDDPQAQLNQILKLDEQRRETIQKLQDAQERRNAASKEIGKAKQAKDETLAQSLMDEVAGLKDEVKQGEDAERAIDTELRDLLAGIPNMPLDDVPVGPDEEANVEIRKWGELPSLSFDAKQHFELGEDLGLMDFETAAKMSGARFVVLQGALARLERALGHFMLDLHTSEHGYTEVAPPLLVRDDTMFGTGQLPKFRDDQFQAKSKVALGDEEFRVTVGSESGTLSVEFLGPRKDELKRRFVGLMDLRNPHLDQGVVVGAKPVIDDHECWLIPTAEVPLTNLVREEIVPEDTLPKRVTAFTPCFRAEAGAAGRDTRGMIRQHQFSKVEMVSITTPDESLDELERMTGCAETVLQRLGLPYRVVTLSTGDMGFSARKTYDIEVWLPGQDAYREISSCSVCGDFQARRMNARYRVKDGKDNRLVHTLNGSGVAVGRALIAVMENYQEADGGIRIPDVLKPYMGGMERIDPPKR